MTYVAQLIPTYEEDYFEVVNHATEFNSGPKHCVEIYKVDRFGGRVKVLEIFDSGGYLTLEEK